MRIFGISFSIKWSGLALFRVEQPAPQEPVTAGVSRLLGGTGALGAADTKEDLHRLEFVKYLIGAGLIHD